MSVPDTPRCVLVTGAIGSGKTFLASRLLKCRDLPYVNPDIYLQYLIRCECCPESERYDRARRLCRRRLHSLLDERRSFVWETVLASEWKWDFLARSRLSHLLTVLYITVDSLEVCLQRAKRRGDAGWYRVPPEKVVESHRSMALGRLRLMEVAHEFVVINNSHDLS